MFWADKVAKQIIVTKKYEPYWVDDMFTPSGFPHIGSLRGPLIHDLIYKALLNTGVEAKFSYIMNDFDPIDGLPEDLNEEFSKYMGIPLRQVPSPKEGFDSFADYFSSNIKDVLAKLGTKPEFLSSWDMYHAGKFNEAIRMALDNSELIQDIYHEISGSKKKESGWLPLQVICEKCGKLGTTRVFNWDGKTVTYKCEPTMVKWAEGCDYEGRISPFDGNGKLPWKIDWPAHWMILGVTIEGAGKDHSVAGSSRDVAREICNKVFKIQEPFNIPYEFLTIGGKKMASSKGLGLKGHHLFDILPPEVGRFLYTRTDYKQEVDFDPNGTMAIPDLFDEYDRCYQLYIEGGDENYARAFELSQIEEAPPKEKTFLPRFRDVVNYVQQAPTDSVIATFTQIKGEKLNETELKILTDRIRYAKIWLEKYAPEEFSFSMSQTIPEQASQLSDAQRSYLSSASYALQEISDPEELQTKLYNLSKEMSIPAKEAFASIYTAINGKTHGPKAGTFLLQFDKDKVVERLKEVAGEKKDA